MKTSLQWVAYFQDNLQIQRINWNQSPQITVVEQQTIVASLQAWQLGETSDGKNLLKAAARYALAQGDPGYVDAVQLFIREEQKHGNNLGKYLDLSGQPRIRKDWGDTLFRRIRYFNTSMELWTIAVITVESTAQLFYQCLKDATQCPLLKEICSDILIDEDAHIHFQIERLAALNGKKNYIERFITHICYRVFFFCTAFVVWAAHRKVFRAGHTGIGEYFTMLQDKFNAIIGALPSKPSQIILFKASTVTSKNNTRYESGK